jgi:hypothetical protein
MAASRCTGLIAWARARRTRSRSERLSAGLIDSLIIITVYPSAAAITDASGFACLPLAVGELGAIDWTAWLAIAALLV